MKMRWILRLRNRLIGLITQQKMISIGSINGLKKPVGPMTWQGIEEVSKKYPDLFVSYESSGNSAKIKHWLPGEIIITAREEISNQGA
mgnify:CR=1 FL=1